jgi:hypothetical protein
MKKNKNIVLSSKIKVAGKAKNTNTIKKTSNDKKPSYISEKKFNGLTIPGAFIKDKKTIIPINKTSHNNKSEIKNPQKKPKVLSNKDIEELISQLKSKILQIKILITKNEASIETTSSMSQISEEYNKKKLLLIENLKRQIITITRNIDELKKQLKIVIKKKY